MCAGVRRGAPVAHSAITVRQKSGLLHDHWTLRIVGEMNAYQFKVVKIQGGFIWHDHQDTDETLLVIDGAMRIDFPDGAVDVTAMDKRGLGCARLT